jgi:hypothetical protein
MHKARGLRRPSPIFDRAPVVDSDPCHYRSGHHDGLIMHVKNEQLAMAPPGWRTQAEIGSVYLGRIPTKSYVIIPEYFGGDRGLQIDPVAVKTCHGAQS